MVIDISSRGGIRAQRYTYSVFIEYERRILLNALLLGLANTCVLWLIGIEDQIILACAFIAPGAAALAALRSGLEVGAGRAASAALLMPSFFLAVSAALIYGVHNVTGYTIPPEPMYVLVTLFSLIASMLKTRELSGQPHLLNSNVTRYLRALKKRSREFLAINLLTSFNATLFFSYLGFFLSLEEVGEFRVAERMAQVVVFNLAIINLIAPRQIASRINNNNPGPDLWRRLKLIYAFQISTTAIAILGVVAFYNYEPAGLRFGDPFVIVLPVLAQAISALTGPTRVLLMYTGRRRFVTFVAVFECLSALVLYPILYSVYELLGVAAAYALIVAVSNAVVFYVWCQHLWNKVSHSNDAGQRMRVV